MKILLIEDNVLKRDKIKKLIDINFRCLIYIDTVDNLESALLKVEEKKYDLYILDLSIKSGRHEASIEFGFQLYDKIISLTKNIIIYSNVDNIENTERKNQFNNDKIDFIDYTTEGKDWENSLIEYLNKFVKIETLFYDISIITALDDEFYWMKIASNTEWYKFEMNELSYYSTKIRNNNDEEVSIIAHSINKMGMSYSSATATKMLMLFRPKILLMTGICAGIEGPTQKGDIIVPEYIFNYQEGDITEEGFVPSFKTKQLNTNISRLIHQTKDSYVLDIKNEWEKNYKVHGEMPGGTSFQVHTGNHFGTGSAVVKDKIILDEIKKYMQKDIIGLDMEGYSIFIATEVLYELNTIPILIKSVQDFATKEKDKKFRAFSCFSSARFFFKLCEDRLITKLRSGL